MARPARHFAAIKRVVRRRHRTWMMSMTMATFGWGVIWVALVLRRYAPNWAPSAEMSYGVAFAFALVGLFFGLFSFRAKLAWILIILVPIFANVSLLSLRTVMPGLLDLATASSDS